MSAWRSMCEDVSPRSCVFRASVAGVVAVEVARFEAEKGSSENVSSRNEGGSSPMGGMEWWLEREEEEEEEEEEAGV